MTEVKILSDDDNNNSNNLLGARVQRFNAILLHDSLPAYDCTD